MGFDDTQVLQRRRPIRTKFEGNSRGVAHARAQGVTAHHFTELVCWQLGDRLRAEAFTFTARPQWQADRKLRQQTEDALGSVCRNIAEGFGCESHDEFARFLEIARRSLNEVQDCLRHAMLKQYMTAAEAAPLFALMRRLYPAINRLWAYLKNTPSPRVTDRRKRASTNKPHR
jgi:four helix bundle protein